MEMKLGGITSVPAILDYNRDYLNCKHSYNKSKNTVFFRAIPNESFVSDFFNSLLQFLWGIVNKDRAMGGIKL